MQLNDDLNINELAKRAVEARIEADIREKMWVEAAFRECRRAVVELTGHRIGDAIVVLPLDNDRPVECLLVDIYPVSCDPMEIFISLRKRTKRGWGKTLHSFRGSWVIRTMRNP